MPAGADGHARDALVPISYLARDGVSDASSREIHPTLVGYTFNPSTLSVRVGPNAGGINFAAKIASPPKHFNLVLVPDTVKQGGRVFGSVGLTGVTNVPVVVAITSSDPKGARVPDQVTVPSGKSGVEFSFTAGSVTQSTTVMIEASYNGNKASADLTVNP